MTDTVPAHLRESFMQRLDPWHAVHFATRVSRIERLWNPLAGMEIRLGREDLID